jgi:hypothetical protein
MGFGWQRAATQCQALGESTLSYGDGMHAGNDISVVERALRMLKVKVAVRFGALRRRWSDIAQGEWKIYFGLGEIACTRR